ncbi:MAG: prolyl oligopeptidase family serine peptidase [Actinobacteria bacterium]|nr:prolyl oligopeptidase family serine peptidase [Actinomycetota bacterium]
MTRSTCFYEVKKKCLLIVSVLLIFAIVFLVGCEVLPFMEPVPGTTCRWDFNSSVDGQYLPCSVYLPNGYNANSTYPLWVDLHALYALPVLDNEPNNPFSVDMKKQADARGLIVLCPWGRNLHSLFIDGRDTGEPNIYDDFSNGSASWTPLSGSWSAAGGIYSQTDTGAAWREAVLAGSTGTDYSVRVKIKDVSISNDSAVGVNLRRNSNGDCYHLDLYKDPNGVKYVRAYKYAGGMQQLLYQLPLPWNAMSSANGWIDFKVSCYQSYLEMYINDVPINLQSAYDATPYGYGRLELETPIPAGPISLCSYGGSYQFDNVRVQNEYVYGESDAMDCIYGTMEKYNIDPSRVYLSGHSQGGLGAFTSTLHHPDMFAASRPADSFTDLFYDYQWLRTYYPENPGGIYASINDGQFADYVESIAGGEPGGNYPERMSLLNGNSARYILENAVNSNFRICHGTPDSNVPNTYDPVQVAWWVPWWIFWIQAPAPEPYTWVTATYRNGKDIADLLASWSSPGRYSSEYITSPYLGHGFQDSYSEFLDYFGARQLNRNPTEVAYKTYDDRNTGAWWLKVQIPQPDTDNPGMARVVADPVENSAVIHARNLSRVELDLVRMGLGNGAGTTITFSVDTDIAPNVFPIIDNTGAFALDLYGPWIAASGYTVKVDGTTMVQDNDYEFSGNLLTVNNVVATGGHTLTIQVPDTIPANLVLNPGAEVETAGTAANWSGELSGGATAEFSWDTGETHTGSRSLRIKNVNSPAEASGAVWISDPVEVTEGGNYQLSSFVKARMFRGDFLGIGVNWYDSSGTLLETVWSDTLRGNTNAANLDWMPVLVSGTAPAGSKTARIVAGTKKKSSGGSVTGSAWFDDFSFTEIDISKAEPTNILPNVSLEEEKEEETTVPMEPEILPLSDNPFESK